MTESKPSAKPTIYERAAAHSGVDPLERFTLLLTPGIPFWFEL
jgi:hypothetical protein